MRQMFNMCRVCLGILVFVTGAQAGVVDNSSVLLGTDGVVHEYSLGGSPVQSFNVPDLGESPRGISVSAVTGEVHVYNGTFNPSLSTLDSGAATWTSMAYAGWSTVNNVSYGGVAHGGNYIFVSDMVTSGDGGTRGVVRFYPGVETERFATDLDVVDLDVGLDGYLYLLDNSSDVHVYNGLTLAFIKTIDTGLSGLRAVTANAAGDIYVVNWSGELHWLDGDGVSIDSLDLTLTGAANQLIDVDLSDDGVLAVGDWLGGVSVTDEVLSVPTFFSVGSDAIFVSFPSDIALTLFDPAEMPVSNPLLLMLFVAAMAMIGGAATRTLHVEPLLVKGK